MKRFPKSVYDHGGEPDPRFSLANERTFLAWVRTGLGLLATGVALEALGVPQNAGFRFAAAALFVALGILATVQAWSSWRRTERAMRLGEPLPGLSVGLALAAGVLVGAVLVLVGGLW